MNVMSGHGCDALGGIVVAPSHRMMTSPSPRFQSPIRVLLQSILRQGTHILWCEVASRSRTQYELYVVPEWDMPAAVVEKFDNLADAVRRHAQLSWLLRESGWTRIPVGIEAPQTHAA
jgi:hypothetical protein